MAQMTIRCSDADLEKFREIAYRSRLSLNSWVLGVLLERFNPPEAGPSRLFRGVEAAREEREQPQEVAMADGVEKNSRDGWGGTTVPSVAEKQAAIRDLKDKLALKRASELTVEREDDNDDL